MAGRPQGVKYFQVNGTGIADQVISQNPVNLYSVDISWTGANVGDLVHIHDNGSAATGRKIFSFRVPTTEGSFPASLPAVGKFAENGLFLNLQASAGNFDICVGYDGP